MYMSFELLSVLMPLPPLLLADGAGGTIVAGQGCNGVRRIRWNMASDAAVLRRSVDPKAILRAVRNLIIGLVVFLVAGNLLIFGAFQLLSRTVDAPAMPEITSIENLTQVDSRLWRGSAPSAAGYAGLASHGVKTIVDLRAEDLKVDEALINSLGMELVRIPMRDGQAPSSSDVQRFLATMNSSDGLVYLHCGAGVGRTGTMSAAYLVSSGQTSGIEAMKRNLAVGPPSLEQITFAAGLENGERAQSNVFFTAVSRLLDAPRRILVRVRGSYL